MGSLLLKGAGSLVGLALSIVLARYLGAEGYGVYSYVFSLVTIIAVFAQVGTPVLLVREVAGYEAKQEWGKLRGVLWRATQAVGVACLVLALVGALIGWEFGRDIGDEKLMTGIGALLLLPSIALTGVFGAGLRGMRRIVQGQLPDLVLRPALFLVLCIVVFVVAEDWRTPFVAMALHAVAGLVVLLAAALFLRKAYPRTDADAGLQYETKAWVRSAIPLSLITGLVVVNGQLDLLILGIFAPAGEIGVYRVAVQASILVTFGLQAMNMAVAPYFARLHAQSDVRTMQRLATLSARVVLLFALPVCVLFVFFGGDLLTLVFGGQFRSAWGPLVILAGGQLVNAAMGSVGYLLNMSGFEQETAKSLALSVLVGAALSFLLTPAFGMMGAALAKALSVITWNLLLYRAAKKKLGIASSFLGGANENRID